MLRFKTPREICEDIAHRVKICRVLNNWSQAELADRAGISVHTLKHFEQKGEIALNRLIKLAAVLDQLQAFESIFSVKPQTTLIQLKQQSKLLKRQRARKTAHD